MFALAGIRGNICVGNNVSSFARALRWLDRLKNEDIHQIYDVFENTIFKTLEHL